MVLRATRAHRCAVFHSGLYRAQFPGKKKLLDEVLEVSSEARTVLFLRRQQPHSCKYCLENEEEQKCTVLTIAGESCLAGVKFLPPLQQKHL